MKKSDVAGRTTMHNHVDEAFEVHLQQLRQDIKVSNIVANTEVQHYDWLPFVCRMLLERYLSPLMLGLTPTKQASWLLLPIGLRKLDLGGINPLTAKLSSG